MSGLDKMIDQIKEEAKASADQILREAKEKAAVIERESADVIAQTQKEAEEKSEALKEDVLKKSRSSAHMQHQREVLLAKQQIIDETIEAAKESLYSLEDKEYFELLMNMLKKHVLAQQGRIRLNQKDLDRLPYDFQTETAQIAAEKGGALIVDSTPAAIDGGFVLVYGGIEENCSFSSVFAEAKETLQDKLRTFLFG